MMVTITRYESDVVFSDFCDEWRELLEDSSANQIFLSCEWQSTWWEAYHPGPMWVLVLRDDQSGQWVGLAPWFLDTEADGTRVVRTIGCVDVTDYLDIVARRGQEEAVYETLAGWLAEHTDEFDVARLCNIPQGSLALARMPQLAQARGLSATVRLQEVCPVVKLPRRFEDYFSLLDKKNRHELRRKLRRATGLVDWYIVGPQHDLNAEMGQFMELMAASSGEKAKFLEDPQNRAFFELIVPKLASRGWLQLSFLTVRGEAAAAYLNFEYNNRVLVYNSGLKPDTHGHLSPGIILLARLIEHAIVHGCEEFDFLRGDEAYKYDMGGQDTSVYQIELAKTPAG
jgi:CelD/BcsL family acetyltransferase involved in cellulose biosynthesis